MAFKEWDETKNFDKVHKCISDNMNNQLLKPFVAEEIWDAIKGLGPLNTPGRDDFLAFFTKSIGISLVRRLATIA